MPYHEASSRSIFELRSKCHKSLLIVVMMVCSFHNSLQSQKVEFSIEPRTACAPSLVTFTYKPTVDGTFVNWTGDSGLSVSGKNIISTNYQAGGTYHILLTVTFPGGTVSVKSDSVIISPQPVANFVASDTAGCAPLSVQFKDLSTTTSGAITHWNWDLDPNPDSRQNPQHVYPQVGTHRVSLSVVNSWGCKSETTIKENYIRIAKGPVLNFSIAPNSTCNDTLTAVFTNLSTDAVNCTWYFGDGDSSTETSPRHFYKTPAAYTVELRSNATPGCESVATSQVLLGSTKAIPGANADTVCQNYDATFKGTTSPGASGKWLFKDKDQVVTGSSASYKFSRQGLYEYYFIATNSAGCTDTARRTVYVKPSPDAAFEVDTLLGCSLPFVVQATNLTVNRSLKFTWNFGDGVTYTGVDPPPHQYNSYDSFFIAVTAIDTTITGGCAAQWQFPKPVRVLGPRTSINANTIDPRPMVTALSQPADTVAIGSSVTLIASGTNDIVSYEWQPADKLVNPHSKTPTWQSANVATVFTVKVANKAGCTAKSSITVEVACAAGTVKIPNVFTPMKATNNRLRPLGVNKTNALVEKFSVFNRRGQKVYEVTKQYVNDIRGWDGIFQNKMQDSGTLVWQVFIMCGNNLEYQKGTAEMIR